MAAGDLSFRLVEKFQLPAVIQLPHVTLLRKKCRIGDR